MPHLEANGTELHYQILGPRPGAANARSPVVAGARPAVVAGARPPVVMIHGLLVGNLAGWYFGAAAQLAKTRTVIVYDLRGHGLSANPREGYRLSTMVDDLEALLERLEVPRAFLVGHSYGALIALHFALRHPARVEKLALVEGPLPPSKAAQMSEFMSGDPDEILAALPDQLRQLISAQKRQARRFVERLQFLLTETDLLANLRGEGDVADATLAGITTPTRLIYSPSSALADVGHRLAAALPRASLAWLDGGHYLPSERPREVAAALEEFLP